jgi:putative transposase
MKYPKRKSPRKQDFDYRSTGLYFITICTQNRLPYFGYIQNGLMCLNDSGGMVMSFWDKISVKFPTVTVYTCVVMPNHTHAVLVLQHEKRDIADTSLTDIIRWFKSITTHTYMEGVHQKGWEPFQKKLWQRSFHDHIIRDERAWQYIVNYVVTNPARWEDDTYYANN